MGKQQNAHNYNIQTQSNSILLLGICICSITANSLTSHENTYNKCSYPGRTKRMVLEGWEYKRLFTRND